ncbi:uncharacterized protein LOC107263886 isoform X2 [Cephus cinctus]|uniref:Uncharacterized protein LOC107263886 isoform X2 n=1 Tax=Cephus cinctus TaxID=211228 RepID=A0AAJ7BIP8_CEPCN|nr:uncharacterized protein LOC107263886 isoform X2 [Cephus cinctus]
MEGADVNGGNVEVAREDPNLDILDTPGLQEEVVSQKSDSGKMDEQEINGDVKIAIKRETTPSARRKLRKFKANSTSTMETDSKPQTRGYKRKLSDPDENSSEESTEFNGFDSQGIEHTDTGSHVLKKLIAEAESAESQIKLRRRSGSRTMFRTINEFADIHNIKKEKDSDKSETDSIGAPNSLESESEAVKGDESLLKSTNSTAHSSPLILSQRSKGSRLSRGASPGSAIKHKVSVDMSNPAFKEPFKYGWRRELVFRATSENSVKRMADIYYYTPKGKKVRSFREVAEYLTSSNLTIDNFTFFKEPIGMDDPEKEIIRDAKRPKDSMTPLARKTFASKRSFPAKKPVEEPPATPTPPRPVGRPRGSGSGFKVKMPGKRGPQKKVKTPPEESEMLPPQWSSPVTPRRNQQPVEKTPPAKPKRALKAKLQEPCSIRCSTSMGLIPSLQCCVCLCLYHPECVGGKDYVASDDYVCKNCQQDTEETQPAQHPTMTPSLTPPPLIPISMLGAQNAKTKHGVNMTPPKLQRIPKTDGADAAQMQTQQRAVSKSPKPVTIPKVSSTPEKKESTWYAQARNEYLHSHDGSLPKPAQNIALMAGKKYIVVPKNNAMAVQPAITVKPDKIGDKPPILHDSPITDVSNTTEMSLTSRIPTARSSETETKVQLDKSSSNESINMAESPVNETPSVSVAELDETVMEEDEKMETETEVAKISESLPISTNEISNVTSNETDSTIKPISSVKDTESEPKKNEENDKESQEETCESAIPSTLESQDNVNTRESDSVKVDDRVATVQADSKKRQVTAETDQRQHFMVSVCAGYHALSRIFQYLKVQELLRAARVCKMWRDLAAHPALWKTVRMKNSQVTDWDGLADSLNRRGTQHLDLRKMLVAGESDYIWKKFVSVIPRVTSLLKLELCRCPVMVVEEVIKSCPQLQVLSAMSIKCDSLNLESVGNLKRCQELRLKAINGMSLKEDLSPLQHLTSLTHLSLTSVKELGKKRIEILESLTNLETLELGECSDFPEKFGTAILTKLHKLERLRLEKGQGSCCTFDILEGISRLPTLIQLELVNFDVKNGFDKCLANCKNIKRLLIIPTYISQSATSNNMVLGGVTELSNNLTHFVWGVTLELLRVTELFVDQCNQMNKQITGDSIPVLKPVPCLKLIEDVEEEETLKSDDKQPNLTNPQVDILPLPQLQKLLLTALPKTRVKILKIPFHATWRQSISDSTTQ